MVPELHAICIVCLRKAVSPAWGTNTVSFTLAIDYIHYHGSFALNNYYPARGGSNNVSFLYFTLDC